METDANTTPRETKEQMGKLHAWFKVWGHLKIQSAAKTALMIGVIEGMLFE